MMFYWFLGCGLATLLIIIRFAFTFDKKPDNDILVDDYGISTPFNNDTWKVH